MSHNLQRKNGLCGRLAAMPGISDLSRQLLMFPPDFMRFRMSICPSVHYPFHLSLGSFVQFSPVTVGALSNSFFMINIGQNEKKTSIGKKSAVNPGAYQAGRPLSGKINVWVRDKKGLSLEKQKAEILLLDEKVPERQKIAELTSFGKKVLAGPKDAQYIYFLLDANDANQLHFS